MAKKTQRKAKAKPKARKRVNPSFVVAWPADLAALVTSAGKGPHKDLSFSRLVSPEISPNKPDSR